MIVDTSGPEREAFARTFGACIIDTGPAGITLARRLAAAGIEVALMEGGALDFTPQSQASYDGALRGLTTMRSTWRGCAISGARPTTGTARCARSTRTISPRAPTSNLVDLRLDDAAGTLTAARFRSFTPEDPGFAVAARSYILCTGGIENPRILLNARSQLPQGIGNGYGLVGRFLPSIPTCGSGRCADRTQPRARHPQIRWRSARAT